MAMAKYSKRKKRGGARLCRSGTYDSAIALAQPLGRRLRLASSRLDARSLGDKAASKDRCPLLDHQLLTEQEGFDSDAMAMLALSWPGST
jgi:hypothetical protein